MSVAPRSSSDTHARMAWLARFGAETPVLARDLLDRFCAAATNGRDQAGVVQAAQALGVLRAQHGHAVAGLVEDLTALRALVPESAASIRLIDSALTVATAAYVDEVTAILASRATRDPLTGLPNRAAFDEAIQTEVRSANRSGAPALLLIDLDNFKAVNDTDGHLAGDSVLVGVADLLREGVRAGDLACRIGGDEFAVLLPRTSQAQASKVARRLLSASRDAAELASPGARVRFSIGVGWLEEPRDPDHLIALTDAAMYVAKAAGGDKVELAAEQASES